MFRPRKTPSVRQNEGVTSRVPWITRHLLIVPTPWFASCLRRSCFCESRMLSSPISQPKAPSYAQYEPHTPSSLRSSSPISSPPSSPTHKTTPRRVSQYKATTSSTAGSPSRRKSSAYVKKHAASTSQWDGNVIRGPLSGTESQTEPALDSLLRERFKRRCLERAQRAREAKVRSGRRSVRYSSDCEDMDMDTDDDEDGLMNDEVWDCRIFRREDNICSIVLRSYRTCGRTEASP